MVAELRSRASFDEVLSLSRDRLVVIDFFATWCPPCTRIAPHFQQLSEELPDVKFFKLDVDAVSEVARGEGIRAMPTFKLYRNGRCEETVQGGNLAQVRAAIERLRPPPPLLEPVLDLAAAEPEVERREAAGILVRIANNILREPLNPKFRRLKVSNKIVTEKLLIVDGAMQCLIAMGFRDVEDAFLLDPEKALDDVRLVKSQIEQIVLSEKPPSCGTAEKPQGDNNATAISSQNSTIASAPAPASTSVLPPAVNVPVKTDETANFQAKIMRTLDMMKVYEQPHLQDKARQAMDWQALSARVNTADTGALVRALLTWFKNDFFTWTDAPPCPSCKQKPSPVGNGQPTAADAQGWASRVELYRCPQHGEVRFPRYNHPGVLLETRTGRCGEWANAFMLVLRAAGVRSRYVLDWTDHVWCEVFLEGRWVHCDPCEAALDKPLIYEAGWGKKLSYVLAFGLRDVQDVTWRYTQRPTEVLSRRQEVDEAWLVNTLISTRRKLQIHLSQVERDALSLETLKELIELLTPGREVHAEELQGRQSGSKEWREQRGELGKDFVGHIIRPIPEELAANRLEVRYNCPSDNYERPLAEKKEQRVLNGWRTLVHAFENISRKVELDWKMVYLSRPEGCPAGEVGFVEWTIDLSESNCSVTTLRLMTAGAEFESAQVQFTVCGDNNVCVKVRGLYINDKDFQGCKRVKVRAELCGGKGTEAWQHAQLFRQKDTDFTLFPLDIVIDLQKD